MLRRFSTSRPVKPESISKPCVRSAGSSCLSLALIADASPGHLRRPAGIGNLFRDPIDLQPAGDCEISG